MNTPPRFILKCPSCGMLVKRPDPMDMFANEVKRYSDFSINISEHNTFPLLAKCSDCNAIFWLCKENSVEESAIADKNKVLEIDKMKFLDLEDYVSALTNGIVESETDELMVREEIWWLYNDRVKVGKALYTDRDDFIRWSFNLERLLRLLDPSNLLDKVAIAEINRNLGAFDNCVRILNSIETDDLIEVREQLIEECRRRNRWVVEIERY